MSKVLHKITVPFKSSMKHQVPADAEIVHVDRDTREFRHAAIWFTTAWVPIDERDEIVEKTWEFSCVYTGETFPDECAYLGTVIEDGYANHVLRTNVRPGYKETY